VDVTGRVGIFGGTFDPPHDGHLVAANEAAWELDLERILFLPAANPPHKQGETVARAEDRVAMVRLAIADNPRFELCTIELDRGGLSYTVETLRELHKQQPGIEPYFIVGMDSLADLPSWHDPAGVLRLARLVAVHRAGWDVVDVKSLDRQFPGAAERVHTLRIPGLDISSTDLRDRIAAGRPVRYLIPDPVIAYIEEHNLFGNVSSRSG
jgi:nicotinate-nucleotide adenylyltransferase